MTQPSNVNMTFDTSLIDLSPTLPQNENAATEVLEEPASTFNDSFSTTDTAPSDDYKQAMINQDSQVTSATPGAKHNQPLPVQSEEFISASTTKEKLPVKYVGTVEAYDTWSTVYDSDGNILQAVDDYELQNLLPQFLSLLPKNTRDGEELRICDLGCGTGRNTIKLLRAEYPEAVSWVSVVGIDASKGMLELAGMKLKACLPLRRKRYEFIQHDFLDPTDATHAPILLPTKQIYQALISTLVLEHFPLSQFFTVLRSLLEINGVALVTNMHDEMGKQSQAGFVSKDGNGKAVKVRGTSWAHSVKETVDVARDAGFEIIGEVGETGVTEDMIERGLVGERGRKWVGCLVWYGMVLRKIR